MNHHSFFICQFIDYQLQGLTPNALFYINSLAAGLVGGSAIGLLVVIADKIWRK